MSALKSVIITLPSKGLVAKTPNIITTTGSGELVRPVTPAQKLSFTTSILMDHKIKMENGAKKQQLHPSVKHMELPTDADVVFKQEEETAPARGKKRRLDHLTWEEKLQRKKLKNRVAAQTSRDRKKAKLDELEETVRMLRERNEMLVEECTSLRTENQTLVSETERLKRDKEVVENKESKEQVCSMCQARVGCTAPTLGSAVSPINPLQQGGAVQTARPLTLAPSASILLKILTLYLLSKTYLANSKETITSNDSKSLPKAFCERLPLKWKQILLNQMSRNKLNKKVSKNLSLQNKWWGRHQVMWKPVHPVKV